MKQVLIDAGNRKSWDEFVAASPYGHTLQSWEWGEFKARTGWEPLRLALCDEGGIRAAAQVLIRRPLPFGFGKVAYVPKGPVLDYADSALLGQILDALVRLAANQHVLALKIEPEVVEPSPLGEELRRRGWRDSLPVQMRSTIWVDLNSSEEEILARQKQKTRYNTRLAQRKGVTASSGTIGDLEDWYAMFRATAQRDGFSIHGLEYYRQALEVLEPSGLARLLLAHHEGDLLAGIIVFRFGVGAQYMYGASSNDKRNLMAPYLLQYEGMRWAKQQGAMVYDLWGIPDQLSEDEELWGVYRHKRGYGGEIVRYVGAFDHVRGRAQQAALERLARPLFKRVARLQGQRAQ